MPDNKYVVLENSEKPYRWGGFTVLNIDNGRRVTDWPWDKSTAHVASKGLADGTYREDEFVWELNR